MANITQFSTLNQKTKRHCSMQRFLNVAGHQNTKEQTFLKTVYASLKKGRAFHILRQVLFILMSHNI